MEPPSGSSEMEQNTLRGIELIVNFGLPLAILVTAYFIGSYIERRHFESIISREAALDGFPVVTFDTMPQDWQAASVTMVTGSIVVSLDYFKRVIAGLRGLVGGRIKTYEPLLERARREALGYQLARGLLNVPEVRLLPQVEGPPRALVRLAENHTLACRAS